jgi:hypothetical protein
MLNSRTLAALAFNAKRHRTSFASAAPGFSALRFDADSIYLVRLSYIGGSPWSVPNAVANIRIQAPGNAKRRQRRTAGANWKNWGLIRNLEVGLEFDLYHPNSPVFFLLYFLYRVAIPFEYVAVTAVN